jgi:type II secretory pathway component PulJ|tara:strand:+ start:263 stop:499 length:237 start_codon:yes stop_codon:yes gene_type:complete
MSESNIISIADILEQKLRKEQELEFYEKQLEELQKKMFFVKKDIEVTNLVIEIINDESRDILRVLREDKFLLEQKDES